MPFMAYENATSTITASKAVFCWVGSLGRGGCVVTKPRPGATFRRCDWMLWLGSWALLSGFTGCCCCKFWNICWRWESNWWGENSYWWGIKRYSSRTFVQKASFQHTCWPCEDWINWATAAKASADGVVELAVTAVTGSLARGGEEPERRDATRISVWADVSIIALSNATYSYQIVQNRLEEKA